MHLAKARQVHEAARNEDLHDNFDKGHASRAGKTASKPRINVEAHFAPSSLGLAPRHGISLLVTMTGIACRARDESLG